MPPATPLSGQWTIHPNNEQTNVLQIEYTKAEKDYLNFRRMRIIATRDTRDAPRAEFDDMPFLQYYEMLKKADDQYVAPRKNAQDTSINLGTIRDKDTSLLEFAASHDWEPVAQVFDDEEDLYEELAEVGEDLVRKSFLIEGSANGGQWKDKFKLIVRSMISFGTALVEDLYVQRWMIDKTMTQGFRPGMGSDQATWEQSMRLQYDGCQAKLWDLRKCYFGDIRKFFMNGPQGQPYFFTVEYESYDVVKQLFGNWDRFKYVPNIIVSTPEISSPLVFSPFWTLRPVSMNYVEILRYYDPVANEFAITLNGVDMLPLMKKEITDESGQSKTLISGFPLTEVSPSGVINFAKYDLEPMHEFAYSKAQPAKMRVPAEVENMLVKAFIGMFKQKWKPTMGNKSGRLYGAEVTDPATVINDLRDGDVFPILPNYTGAVPADFSFFEIMKKELDKNSIERSWQGIGNTQQDETATQDMNDRKAQTLKVAAMFDGIISGNTQLYWLRTFNIMKNWTKAVDTQVDVLRKQIVDKYRTVTVASESGGERVTKKIIFTKDTPKLEKGKKRPSLDDSFDMMDEEEKYKTEFGGGEIRLVYMHPELFASMEMSWYYSCVPIPNDSDPLSYMLFAKQVQDAIAMFGPDSLNVKKLKHRFTKLTGNDFDTWFIPEQELQMMRSQQQAAGGAQPGAGASAPLPGQKPGGNPTIAGVMAGKNPALALGSMMK